jgi:primosomal replication protein PriB
LGNELALVQDNYLEISGVVCELGETVVSPSGVPHTMLKIDHRSLQTESGHERKVECRIAVQLSGNDFAEQRAWLTLGQHVHVKGFLIKNSYRDDPAWIKLQAKQIVLVD